MRDKENEVECGEREEHLWGSTPWLLTEQQSNDVKEVIRRIKFPTGFSSNINNILMKKGEFCGVKTHDWHTFVKVMLRVNLRLRLG